MTLMQVSAKFTFVTSACSQKIAKGLQPLCHWLDAIEFHHPKVARMFCKLIPASCPFERDIKLFGRTLFHIPPLCKLNPFYEQFVGLRFRALCFLADECGEYI
jgi:Mo-dependent nitrogenase C-terminus